MTTAVPPRTYSFDIDGPLLKRGFWFYAVSVASPIGPFLYVGRTGDTSSRFAASPMSRLAAHFNLKATARGNSLIRNLEKLHIDPRSCRFSFFAVGPIHPEQASMDAHRLIRGPMASVEAAVAHELQNRGYRVLGCHPRRSSVPSEVLAPIIAAFSERFPHVRSSAGA